jgi:hypothetical protein
MDADHPAATPGLLSLSPPLVPLAFPPYPPSPRGVSWCKRRLLWEAAISINGKRER